MRKLPAGEHPVFFLYPGIKKHDVRDGRHACSVEPLLSSAAAVPVGKQGIYILPADQADDHKYQKHQ